jgi:hypothetical protein
VAFLFFIAAAAATAFGTVIALAPRALLLLHTGGCFATF